MLNGTHRYLLQERVVYGKPAAEAVAAEVAALDIDRAFVTSTRSLSGEAGLATRIAAALGPRCAGIYSSVAAHSPRECVIEGAAQARAAGVRLLIAVGGGSVVDATKAMLLCLWHDITKPEELEPYRRGGPKAERLDPSRRPAGQGNAIRMLAVPTTFSAAEFTGGAGITHVGRRSKEGYDHPLFVPQTVILDPSATLGTPLELLLSTGVKALDHAVERLCAPETNPYSDATGAEAIQLLVRALPAIKARPDELAARLDGQFGMWLSITGAARGIGVGASHAIGHTLGGTYGVPHGITSCVTLPAVLRWNAPANAERQRRISALMGSPDRDAAELVLALVAGLGLPTRLRDIGIRREDFAAIAEHTMTDRAAAGNPPRSRARATSSRSSKSPGEPAKAGRAAPRRPAGPALRDRRDRR
jgi:maleylacetate reductase